MIIKTALPCMSSSPHLGLLDVWNFIYRLVFQKQTLVCSQGP